MVAILQPSGTTPVTNELLKIIHSGHSTMLANSNSSLGCTLSGPGDFVVLRLNSSFLISSVVNSSSLECCEYSTLAKVGISSTFSFVKTTEIQYHFGLLTYLMLLKNRVQRKFSKFLLMDVHNQL